MQENSLFRSVDDEPSARRLLVSQGHLNHAHMIDGFLKSKLEMAYDAISSVNERAYRDPYLLSNLVLSKNPFGNNFLINLFSNKAVRRLSPLILFKRLAKYYAGSLFHYVLYVLKFAVFCLENKERAEAVPGDRLTVVDTYFLVDRIVQAKRYSELYFPGLDEVLKTRGGKYVYLPVFDGSSSISVFRSLVRIINRQGVPLLCEYQLLSFTDLLRLLSFIILYPWRVLVLAGSVSDGTNASRLLKHELLDTLDQVTFHNYCRLLQGKRIAELPCRSIKLISWYENQAMDKNLYKGIRMRGNDIKIYGAQLFLHSEVSLNVPADEKEKEFDVIPDRIIVNGPAFMEERSSLDYRVGPSLRYGELFKVSVDPEKQTEILVLLPYSLEISRLILKVVRDAGMKSTPFVVKMHPTRNLDELGDLIGENWFVRDDNIYGQFKRTRMVIGSSSGSLVEAAAVGIPVIQVKTTGVLDFAMLPELGKGIIWEEVSNGPELRSVAGSFDRRLKEDLRGIREVASRYKKMFFCEPTNERIIEAFDL